jgi:hypothetical protein
MRAHEVYALRCHELLSWVVAAPPVTKAHLAYGQEFLLIPIGIARWFNLPVILAALKI